MQARSSENRWLGLLRPLVAAAAFLTVLHLAVDCAFAGGKSWRKPDRVATSVEIDDDGIIIRTESRTGGRRETIEIMPEGGDDVIILRDRDWKRKFKCRHRTRIDWDWDDLDDLEWLEIDDCDGDAIVNFGSDVYIGKSEHIEGDVVAIGGSIYVEGEVDGDVVAVGGSVSLGSKAEVDGDVVAVAGDVELRDGSEIDGDAISVGGDMDDRGALIHGDTVLIEFDLW